MPRTAFDTSAILPALLAWHEHHALCLPILQQALDAATAIVPLPALVESYAVMTRLPPPWRLSSKDAHDLLTRTFRGCAEIAWLDGEQAWGLLDAAVSSSAAGGATYDAHIIACAERAGATRIVSLNRRDFARLCPKSLSVLVPM